MAVSLQRSLSQYFAATAAAPVLKNVTGYTITLWYRYSANVDPMAFLYVSTGDGETLPRLRLTKTNNSSIGLRLRGSDGDSLSFEATGEGALTDTNAWAFLTIRVNIATGLIEYFNNLSLKTDDTFTATSPTSNTDALRLFIAADGDVASAEEFWDGAFEDIRVYGRVLTSEEMQTIYNGRGTDSVGGYESGLRFSCFTLPHDPGAPFATRGRGVTGTPISNAATTPSGNFSIVQGAGAARAVVAFTNGEFATEEITDVTLNGVSGTKVVGVVEPNGLGNTSQAWVWLDANLPASPGSYAYNTSRTGTTPDVSIIFYELTGVAQVLPSGAMDNGTGDGGNGTTISGNVDVPAGDSFAIGQTGCGFSTSAINDPPSGTGTWTRGLAQDAGAPDSGAKIAYQTFLNEASTANKVLTETGSWNRASMALIAFQLISTDDWTASLKEWSASGIVFSANGGPTTAESHMQGFRRRRA